MTYVAEICLSYACLENRNGRSECLIDATFILLMAATSDQVGKTK